MLTSSPLVEAHPSFFLYLWQKELHLIHDAFMDALLDWQRMSMTRLLGPARAIPTVL